MLLLCSIIFFLRCVCAVLCCFFFVLVCECAFFSHSKFLFISFSRDLVSQKPIEECRESMHWWSNVVGFVVVVVFTINVANVVTAAAATAEAVSIAYCYLLLVFNAVAIQSSIFHFLPTFFKLCIVFFPHCLSFSPFLSIGCPVFSPDVCMCMCLCLCRRISVSHHMHCRAFCCILYVSRLSCSWKFCKTDAQL